MAAVGEKTLNLAIGEGREGKQEVGEHNIYFFFSKIKTKKTYRMDLIFCDCLP